MAPKKDIPKGSASGKTATLKKPTMSTSQMISQVASRFELLPKKMTKEVIATFLTTLEGAVTEGKKLRIDRIGILQVKDRAPRIGRNPQTGQEIKIPASKKIAFRASKSLKEQVALGTSRQVQKLAKKSAPKK